MCASCVRKRFRCGTTCSTRRCWTSEDREVEVVYDIRLVRTNGKLYVSDVDISRYGLLRQVGFRSLADYLYKRADEAKKKLIPWSYVQPLSPQLGALQGNSS